MRKLLEEQPEGKVFEKDSGEEERGEEDFEAEEFEVSTLTDFVDALKFRHDEAEDEEIKTKLARQIDKIKSGLNTAHLSASAIKVIAMPDDVLGAYNPNARQISASEDMLSDFNSDERLFRTVFIHERTHKEGIADEGLTQLSVGKETRATPGIYSAEKQKARRTFYAISVDKALDLYDMRNPERLANYFLKVELKRKYGGKNIKPKKLGSISRQEAGRLEELFKDGAKKFTEKLKSTGYNFKTKIEKILESYVKEL